MEFSVKSGNPEKQRTACVIVGVFQSRRLSPAARQLDDASEGFLSALLRRGDMEGETGQTLWLYSVPHTLCERVLLVGCGREKDFDDKVYRKVTETATKALDRSGATEAVSYLTELPIKGRDRQWRLRIAVEAVEDALYRFDKLKSEPETRKRPLRRLVLTVGGRRELLAGEQAVREGSAIASGKRLAKDLANLPGNLCTPEYLAEQALQLARMHQQLEVSVLDEDQMSELGMGAMLAVSRGSQLPARLIIMHYRGADPDQRPLGLVGKGITFDSGGISIKPAQAMDEMKFDMGGAASVFGAITACAELQLPINLVGVIAAAENMPDGRAARPGDVITTLSGQTVEILNTDAEGRLVLCDALTYLQRFEPSAVVDIATLTGSCVVALGHHAHGLLSNSQGLANDLLQAGRTSLDRAWELPLWDDYQEQLKSPVADMANIGGKPAGTITAACFLSRFTKKYRWAHLDVAGTAWRTGEDKGATGRPVPLLAHYLLSRAASST